MSGTVQTQGFDTLTTPQQITNLEDISHTVERRFLQLVKEGAEETISVEDLVGELSLLSKEVQRCYRLAMELTDQRDLSFRATQQLEDIGRHCIWLYRRICLEQSFFRKWHLERKLRDLISPEAFAVYEEIVDAEVRDRELLVQSDADIRALVLKDGQKPP